MYLHHVNDLEVGRKYWSRRDKSNFRTSMLIFVESQILRKQVILSQQKHQE